MSSQDNNTIHSNRSQVSSTHQELANLRKPYTEALLKANAGINEMQARTIVYWGTATFYDEVDPFPILFIKNDFGCGKSDLIETLFPMCEDSEPIKGETEAAIRNELANCRTAFFDEHEDLPEKWLLKRFKKSNAKVDVLMPTGKGGFITVTLNLFGATVIVKRTGFKDGALNSRCLTIQPKYIEGCKCHVTNVGSLQPVVNKLGKLPKKLKARVAGRTGQVWKPLEAIALAFNDSDWLDWAKKEFGVDMEAVNFNRFYEPRELVLGVVETCRQKNHPMLEAIDKAGTRFKLSDIRNLINTETEKELKAQEIGETLIREGYKVGRYEGFMSVQVL